MKRVKGVFLGIVSFVLWCIALANTCNMQLYEQKFTSFNMMMDYYMLQTSSCVSGISCSRWCINDQDCVSFMFDAETSNCTTFSSHVASESGDNMEHFYVKKGWQPKVICDSNVPDNTSFVNVALGKLVILSSQYRYLHGGFMVPLYIERMFVYPAVRSQDSSPSEQQAEYIKFKPDAHKVDGNRSPEMPCAHTLLQHNPYALIDLQQTYKMFSFYIVNRGQGIYSQRLHDLKILVGNDPNNLSVCIDYPDTIGRSCTFRAPIHCQGQYVKLQLFTREEYLTLCEIEVYGIL